MGALIFQTFTAIVIVVWRVVDILLSGFPPPSTRTRMVGTQFNLPPASVERFHSVCFRNFLQFIPPNGWLMLWTNQSKIVCCTAAKKWILERCVVGWTTRCCGLCGVMTSDEVMLPVHSSCNKNDQIMVRQATSKYNSAKHEPRSVRCNHLVDPSSATT